MNVAALFLEKKRKRSAVCLLAGLLTGGDGCLQVSQGRNTKCVGQWALSGYSPVGHSVYEMTFKHFQGRTEGLIINATELLLT